MSSPNRVRATATATTAVLGKKYHVLDDPSGYVESGTASFYGQKFHGRRTSSLEVYDMYAFSAAHKTLPLPSFARVTNLANGKSVVVRVNDRGPFHDGRVIDLSYAAAVKLGVYPRRHRARRSARAHRERSLAPTCAWPRPIPLPPPVVPSAMDRMVAALPIASAQAGERKPASAERRTEPSPPGPWRFDMRQDGKAMTADEFDKWMKERQVRVATGKSGTPDKHAPVAPVQAPVRVDTAASNDRRRRPRRNRRRPRRAAASCCRSPVSPRAPMPSARWPCSKARAFAMRACFDANAGGQKVWRLRVGPVAGRAGGGTQRHRRGSRFRPPKHRARLNSAHRPGRATRIPSLSPFRSHFRSPSS